MSGVFLISSQLKKIRDILNATRLAICSEYFSNSPYPLDVDTDNIHKQIDNLRRGIYIIVNLRITLSDKFVVELLATTKHCFTVGKIKMLFLSDQQFEREKHAKELSIENRFKSAVQDIEHGVSEKIFREKYFDMGLDYDWLKKIYIEPLQVSP